MTTNIAHNIKQTAHCRNSILEIRLLSELFQFIKHHPIVFLDLDNTLIMPDHASGLGSDQWFLTTLNQYIQSGMSALEAKQKLLKIRNVIFDRISFKTVEEHTRIVLKTLRHHEIPCFLLTSRGTSVISATERHLADLSLSFENTMCKDEFEILRHGPETVKYKDGVIYCSGVDKGLVLKTFLNIVEVTARRIILVDDNYDNLHAAARCLADVEFTGLRYCFLDEQVI